jgi:hypothetical protein
MNEQVHDTSSNLLKKKLFWQLHSSSESCSSHSLHAFDENFKMKKRTNSLSIVWKLPLRKLSHTKILNSSCLSCKFP